MYAYVYTYYAPTHVDRGGSHTQQTRSTEKDEDVNWVRTNLRTRKNHSAESCTVIPQLATGKLYRVHTDSAWNLHEIYTEALRNPHKIRSDFLRNSSDFVKFLVTCTVLHNIALILCHNTCSCCATSMQENLWLFCTL